ncbi:MAG TPA: inositol monophosphatase [Acidimicrobiia bacterium]|nr:inositol monophosphatase [Acidimicrobiia bacterium]
MLTDADLDARAALVEELARWAIDRIPTRPAQDEIGTKTSDADWVTETDLAVERHVREAVRERFPDDRIVGEEFGATDEESAPATWYVDPVDGTTNYVHGLPWSSFSCAVVDDDGTAIGAVADPYRREVLSAVRGRGARRNGEPTHCASADTLVGGIFLTELTMQWVWDGLPRLMGRLSDAGCVTRIMGSNALSLASVGAGRSLVTMIGEFGPIDCQAGMLIAAESGAAVRREGPSVVCAAPGIVEEFLELYRGAANGS